MPKQYVLFGRPVPRLGSRRISLLLVGISTFALFSLLFTLPSVPTGPSLQIADHKFGIPKSLASPWRSLQSSGFNPFRQPSHPPPRQHNDTDGEASWYSNWKWLSIPFSSMLTLDENRSLLPDVVPRTPIYCYYDNTIDKDAASRDAESDVLLTWRRAWWARGFKPVILSPAEAMNNPMYEELQHLEMDPALKTDLMRWLAWENMGGGLLAHYLLFPMASHQEPLLKYLRRGEFPTLTRWKDLEDGLFAGAKTDIAKAIKLALASPNMKTAKDFLSAMETKIAATKEADPFAVDAASEALAFYNAPTIEKKYGKIGEAIAASRADGLKSLNQLVNSHLHVTWQNVYSSGIEVVKPVPHHTTHLISPAYELAQRLTRCPDTPLPASCPPNRPKCIPCVSATPMKISTPSRYHNTSTLYVIATVPHPYTTALLSTMKDRITIAWLRRESARDQWLADLTKGLLGTEVSAALRVLKFKEAVASEHGASRSLWLQAETEAGQPPNDEDLDWHFGFAVPNEATLLDTGRSETPVPGPERRPPPPLADPKDGPVADPDELKREPDLLKRAREVVAHGSKRRMRMTGSSVSEEELRLRDAVEAWNLADMEAWRFARAYLARSLVERKTWEEEEAKYAGGVGSSQKRRAGGSVSAALGRWLDSDKEEAAKR